MAGVQLVGIDFKFTGLDVDHRKLIVVGAETLKATKAPDTFEVSIEGVTVKGAGGRDTFTITGVAGLKPRQDVEVKVTRPDGSVFTFTALCRIDTANEVEYFMNGGILQYVLRKLAA